MTIHILGVFPLKRTLHHLALTLATAGAVYLSTIYIPGGDPVYLLTLAFGYQALLLILVSLMVGPANLLLRNRKRNPVNLMLRRDVGIWAGMLTVLHVVLALQLRFGGQLIYYFVEADDTGRLIPRLDLFGLSNITGTVAFLIIVLLLATSNQFALRKLKGPRWKTLQRWNYAAIIFAIVHTAGYQVISRREQYFETATIILVTLVAAIQLSGAWLTRQRDKRTTQTSPTHSHTKS